MENTEATTASTGTGDKTTHRFQAAVTRVLGLVINSLYSNKDIFLRELVSNASDAIDRLKFRALTEPDLLGDETLRIRISVDRERKHLIISDNGVGMTREELTEHLGTVAHSGSQAFLERLEAAKNDVSLIGQFGVGFYSGYLIADRIEVVSRAAGHTDAWRWSSDAEDTFTMEPAERVERGTDVILHLKQDDHDLLEPYRIRSLIKRYSDYIGHPIELEKPATKAGGDTPSQTSDGADTSGGADTSDGADTSAAPTYEQVNEASALWQRSSSDITDEQYEEFYKHLTHDWENPVARRHFKIEGTQLFTGLLFLPSRPPFDLFNPDTRHGIRLHVKRVFIMDDCEELLPRWLRFVRGVVDSEDLPLNVSREILQDSRIVRTMRKQIVKHSLDMIEGLAETDAYAQFWRSFGAVLKEGLHFEPESKERLAKLCRWESTGHEGLVSLADYVGRMKEGQNAIYYVFGPSRSTIENAPHLEVLKKRGYEVLLMTDAIDQWAVDGLGEFEGKPLVSAMAADLKLETTEEEKKDDEAEAEGFGALIGRVRQVLQDRVSEVRMSRRLADSPACLVLPEGGLPPYLERLMRSQSQGMPSQKRVLELNPDHAIVQNLRALHEKSDTSEDVSKWVELLHDQALLAEGSPVEDPNRLVTHLTELLTEASARAVS